MARRTHHQGLPLDFERPSPEVEQIERALFPEEKPRDHNIQVFFGATPDPHPTRLGCADCDWTGSVVS